MYSIAEPADASLDELATAITAGAVRLAVATASWLRLIAEFDSRGGWHGVGILSCAHWLAWQCGMGPGAAREHVRVARALGSLPLIDTAFSTGRLSYSKVRALTRVAAPDCEESLLEFALSATASQTERFCRAWRRIDDEDAGRRPFEEGVRVDYATDDDGFFTLEVRGPVERGAPLMAAIESLAEREARRERAQAKSARAGHEAVRAAGGTVDDDLARRCADDADSSSIGDRIAARRMDALVSLAEARVAIDRRAGDPPRREVVLHVDVPVLADDTAAGRAHYEGGAAITGAQARRILCEATVMTMIEQGREALAVGRRRRRATKAQRRALLRRDGGCARPGCPETRIERLHAHHLRNWLFGGRTDLRNLVLLCDADHGLVHDLELVMARRDGRLIVTAPDGRRVWGTADAAFDQGLLGLDRDPTASTAFAGVPPFDTTVGRRPSAARSSGLDRGGHDQSRRCVPARRSGRVPRPSGNRGETSRMSRVLFPNGAPDLPATLQEGHDRLDLDYAIGVLMGNRDLVRRLAEESGAQLTG